MIGKSEWFERRKYGGWGLHPKDWRGWVYVVCFMAPLIIFHSFSFWGFKTRLAVTSIWAIILVIDTLDIMANMKKDERDRIHEAISERNAMWAITIILTIGIAYQIAVSSITKNLTIDWFLVCALVVGLLIKSLSNYYLDKND